MVHCPMDPAIVARIREHLETQYSNEPGVEGFGQGDGTVRIYVRSKDVGARLPREFAGVPVELVVVGDITAY